MRLLTHLARVLLLAALLAPATTADELVRTAISSGSGRSTGSGQILGLTLGEAGVIGRTSGGGQVLLEGFWFPPLALLPVGEPLGHPAPSAPEVRLPAPNPFQASTVIPYGVSSPAPVRMQVYDVTGRAIRALVDETHDPGWFVATWDGRDRSGRRVASGVYYVETRIGSFRSTTRVLVTR